MVITIYAYSKNIILCIQNAQSQKYYIFVFRTDLNRTKQKTNEVDLQCFVKRTKTSRFNNIKHGGSSMDPSYPIVLEKADTVFFGWIVHFQQEIGNSGLKKYFWKSQLIQLPFANTRHFQQYELFGHDSNFHLANIVSKRTNGTRVEEDMFVSSRLTFASITIGHFHRALLGYREGSILGQLPGERKLEVDEVIYTRCKKKRQI